MSSTDSDLDFESADEDTEYDKITKENIPEKTEIVEISSNTAKVSETADEVTETSATNNDKLESLTRNESLPEDTADTTSIADKSIKSDVLNKLDDKRSNDTVEENVVDDTSSSMADGANIEVKSKPEPQRVPLRLEKKMQQKSQISKELSQEKTDVIGKSADVREEKSLHEADTVKEKPYSWGFSSWGTSLLSTAASSVSTFSSQVSQGIGTVIETVESTLGAPSPEELASVLNEKKGEKSDVTPVESEVKKDEAVPGILPDVSSWTKVFENTGSKVIMGGLDTLEFLGKKTMDILTEGDPGLRNKRNVFSDGVNLSQILREAKAKADEHDERMGTQDTDVIHYSQVFDDQQGLVHLEALEMLSKQAQAKFQRLLMRHSNKTAVKKSLEEIKSICENIPALDDPSECEPFEDFESVFRKHVLELNLPLNADNIVKTQRKLNDALKKYEGITEEPFTSPDELFQSSICSLAEFTARCIETFHKVAELILVQPFFGPETEHCATNLTGLTTVMCIEINNLSSKYHKCLDSSAEHFPNYTNPQDLNITAMVTNLYVEASNSNKYIQDAFQMLVPVLQACLLECLDE